MKLEDNLEPVCAFEISRYATLDASGEPIGTLPAFANDRASLVALYRALVLTRTFDEKAIALQRTGRLGTYASSLGQEAISIGAAAAMQADDVLFPSFREHGAQLWRGVTPVELLQYWGGDERGSNFQAQHNDFPVSIPVASHIPHACGAALAMKLRGERNAALAIFGDGATSKGDFYEAINIAGAWALPAVFVICNNQWAISVPRSEQTATETLAQKAIAAGIEGIQVDGNDVIAVRHVCESALEQARNDNRPMLVEAVTYRMGDHTTADDARRYRSDDLVSQHWKKDPVARLRVFLVKAMNWSHEDEEGLIDDCRNAVEQAADTYLSLTPEDPEAMFDTLFAELPESLQRQRNAVTSAGTDNG